MESQILIINKQGHVLHSNVRLKLFPAIQKKPLAKVRGIIVHQTGGPTAQSAFNSYAGGNSGAHFLIDRDGTIYQTASLLYQTWHVGKLRARCLAEHRCSPAELKLLQKFNPTAEYRREIKKSVPDRYPANQDSLGIELVGDALPKTAPEEKKVYEAVTDKQNASLKWLIEQLRITLGVPLSEVFRHPVVSRKNPTEASTAKW